MVDFIIALREDYLTHEQAKASLFYSFVGLMPRRLRRNPALLGAGL
jgi:hypothetical protein